MKKIFWMVTAFIGIGGGVKNAWAMAEHFYLWPLVRCAGYSALAVYALLMLRRARYNTGSISKEES